MLKLKSSFFYSLFGTVLLVGSVILNVLLAEQLRGANSKLAKLVAEANVEIGATLPDIEAKTLDGKEATYSFSTAKHPTVIYVFSPSCGWCAKNQDNVRALLEKKGSDFQFVGLSASTLKVKEYIDNQSWRFPVFVEPSVAMTSAYKLGSTPQTIVVSEDGKVLRNWKGAFTPGVQKEVEEYFNITLPGLRKE